MASIQFSIGTLYQAYASKRARKFRGGLTLAGLGFVALALFFEVYQVMDSGWLWLPLIVLLAGGLGPAAWILRIEVPGWLRGTRRNRFPGAPSGNDRLPTRVE